MSEFAPSSPLEKPNPPELERQTYDGLVRYATMFANMQGSPLELSVRDFHNSYGDERNHYVFSDTSGMIDAPAIRNDIDALFQNPDNFKGLEGQAIGAVAARIIDKEDLPFDMHFDNATLQAAVFSEAAMPFIKPYLKDTDLPGLPLATVSLSFDRYESKDGTGENEWAEGEYMKFMILPPSGPEVGQSFRIREYGEWSFEHYEHTHPYYQAIYAMTGHNLPLIMSSRVSEYDFARAASTQLEIDEYTAAGGNLEDLPYWNDKYEGFINGDLLVGTVGNDGAEVLQRLIEIAMHYGKPVPKA